MAAVFFQQRMRVGNYSDFCKPLSFVDIQYCGIDPTAFFAYNTIAEKRGTAMKNYTTIPLLFGVFWLLIGIASGMFTIVVLFGILPILVSLLLMRSKREKQKNQQFTTPVCARCKKSIEDAQTVWIGNHRFCQACAKMPAASANPAEWKNGCARNRAELETPARIQQKRQQSQRELMAVLTQICDIKKEEQNLRICFICKRNISENELIFVDGNYYCRECYEFGQNARSTQPLVEGLCQISYEIGGLLWCTDLDRLSAVTDRLIDGGFVFHTACVGGGINEITHGGIMAYNASYKDYVAFKNNMEKDFRKAEQEERSGTNGVVGSLDYSYIRTFLSRNSLKVCVHSENGGIRLYWIDSSDKAFGATRVFAESVNEEAFGNEGVLNTIDSIQLTPNFLNNWN